MKLIFKIIAGINLLPILCCGQQIVWQNHYGGGGFDNLETAWGNSLRILCNDNKEYLVGGSSRSYSSSGDQYVIKVDDLGNIIWEINAGNPYESDYATSLIKTFDGNYIMAGNANMQFNSNDIRITKFNENGDTVFSKIVPADSLFPATPTDVCYTQDSNFIAACGSWGNIFLVKFNDNGDTLWTKRPMPDSLNFGVPLCFQPAPDFSAYYGVTVHNNYDYYWFKTDTAGQLLDFKRIENPGQYEVEVKKAVILPNGNILAYGGGMSPAGSELCPNVVILYDFLFEYNSEGEIIREKILCARSWDTDPPYIRNFYEFIVADDSSIYFVFDKFIYKINSDWEYEWADTLDIPANAQLMKLAQFEYGYLIAAGQIQLTPEDINIFMCKIALPEAIGLNEKNEDRMFKIYPNPAANNLILQTTPVGKTEYSVYDISGRLLQSGRFVTSKTIDVSSFAVGLYVIQLQSQQGLVSRKFAKQ